MENRLKTEENSRSEHVEKGKKTETPSHTSFKLEDDAKRLVSTRKAGTDPNSPAISPITAAEALGAAILVPKVLCLLTSPPRNVEPLGPGFIYVSYMFDLQDTLCIGFRYGVYKK